MRCELKLIWSELFELMIFDSNGFDFDQSTFNVIRWIFASSFKDVCIIFRALDEIKPPFRCFYINLVCEYSLIC